MAVLAADGFEQVELTMPVAALRRAGADVRVLSLRPGNIRGMNFLLRGKTVPVDDVIDNARLEDYGAVLVPGGFINPDLLRQSDKARQFVRAADQAGFPIATICHGPALLISAGLVRGRRVASWPGIADDVRNAGGTFTDEKTVRDNNWISARSPLDLPAFIPSMIELFAERAPVTTTKLRRPVRWGSAITRTLTYAAIPLAIAAVQQARKGTQKARTRQQGSWLASGLVGLIGLAAFRRLTARPPRLMGSVSKGYRRWSDLASRAPDNGVTRAQGADVGVPQPTT
ncbi:MAG TPA: type 1 glutamine amidotransferase domain-containing protein [Polyangia bacterium]